MRNLITGVLSFYYLMQMSILNVSDNKLKELPESIGGCNSLEELRANGIHHFLQFYHELISVQHPLLCFHVLVNTFAWLILYMVFYPLTIFQSTKEKFGMSRSISS